MIQKKYIKDLVFGIFGAILGYLYYYFIGCRSGSCPITSNAYLTTLYGAAFGFVFGWDVKRKNTSKNKPEGDTQ